MEQPNTVDIQSLNLWISGGGRSATSRISIARFLAAGTMSVVTPSHFSGMKQLGIDILELSTNPQPSTSNSFLK